VKPRPTCRAGFYTLPTKFFRRGVKPRPILSRFSSRSGRSPTLRNNNFRLGRSRALRFRRIDLVLISFVINHHLKTVAQMGFLSDCQSVRQKREGKSPAEPKGSEMCPPIFAINHWFKSVTWAVEYQQTLARFRKEFFAKPRKLKASTFSPIREFAAEVMLGLRGKGVQGKQRRRIQCPANPSLFRHNFRHFIQNLLSLIPKSTFQ